MKDAKEILENEDKYKKLFMNKLSKDKRLTLSCPDFRYPEPVFVYVKSVKTEKIIAVRFDGGDNTMRFWDYIDDDDYSSEDGVWDKMTEKGLDSFIKKLYGVMEKAIDIEFFDIDGECEDYFSGVADYPLTAENAVKQIKKCAGGVEFVFAKFSNFFGDIQFVTNAKFQLIKR